MEIKKANIYHSELELKKLFKHGSFERTSNSTVFLELIDEFGNKGYGEALPREYVTGEDLKSVMNNVQKYIRNIPRNLKSIREISDFLNECEPADSKNMAALCCLDLALIDLYSRTNGKSVSDAVCAEFGYQLTGVPRITSATLGLDTPVWKKTAYFLAGFKDIKLKIDSETRPERINQIGGRLITPSSFRLDGNCSLTPKTLEKILERVNVPLDCIEQPFAQGVDTKLNGYNFMADESLVSLEDSRAIDFDLANIRIGKNGGILRTLDIIKQWEKRGKKYIIGSLVGETNILSSALLHVARITHPWIVEGCYSHILLKREPTDIRINLGYGGKVRFDYSGPGLGVGLNLKDTRLKLFGSNKYT